MLVQLTYNEILFWSSTSIMASILIWERTDVTEARLFRPHFFFFKKWSKTWNISKLRYFHSPCEIFLNTGRYLSDSKKVLNELFLKQSDLMTNTEHTGVSSFFRILTHVITKARQHQLKKFRGIAISLSNIQRRVSLAILSHGFQFWLDQEYL